jgi:hypothetical protein
MEDPLSATMLIPDFDPERIVDWVKNFKKYVGTSRASLVEHYQRGGDLYHVGDNSNGYYFLDVDGEVIYFVRYRKILGGGNTFGRQVLVARLADRGEATKVAAHVFFKYLLPKFGALSTDTQQTKHGRQFWLFALSEALAEGHHVYAYDRRSTPNTLTELHSQSELSSVQSMLWGTDQGHKRTHAVISKTPITIKEKHERKIR